MDISTLKIIRLDPSGWARYKELRLDALLNDPDSFGGTYAEAFAKSDGDWIDRLSDDNTRWLFAEVDGILVSMACGYYEPADDGLDAAWIGAVYTKSAYRGKGIMRKILEGLVGLIREDNKVDRIFLHVNKDAVSAINVYEKVGFRRLDPVEDYVTADGRSIPQYLMRLEL